MSKPDTESSVKTVLAWGSVSYAFGFFTVMLHTARLGLPVIELIQPVYVWVGLPLAGVGYVFRQIYQYFRKRSAELAAEIRGSLGALSGKLKPVQIDLLAETLGALSVLPGVRLIMFPPVKRFVTKHLEPVVMPSKDDSPQAQDRQAQFLHRLIAATHLVAAFEGAMNLLGHALLIVLCLGLYVWAIYPLIPQGIGGGKATSVLLVVEKDALPPEVIGQSRERPVGVGSVDVKTVTLPVTLLYLTQDFFFVDVSSGARLSIKSSAIHAVEWNPKNSPSDISRNANASALGIHFNTGKAMWTPDSPPTLQETAKLLTTNPNLKLHVIGHTDNVGTLKANMQLSKRRANAVVAALIAAYHIAPGRLDATGIGPLSPIATNRREDGRAKNRRVELVEQ